jgi:glutamate-1-semialdehyde 2,1-aminomutase
VISGFRLGYHGYGRLCGVQPDLVTLGKIVGGGLPVAAVVGPAEILDQLAPLGPVYQAGTMAGNPVALAAGIATLETLASGRIYDRLESLGRRLETAVAGTPGLTLVRKGSVVWPYYAEGRPVEADDIAPAAVSRYHGAYAGWLDAGLYLPPSAYEVSFLSAAHSDADVDRLADALRRA